MQIRTIDQGELLRRMEAELQAPIGSDEAFAGCLRRELGALGNTTRRVLLDLVTARLGRVGAADRDRILSVVQQLETLGDITRGPGGRLAAGPLRLVTVREGAEYLVLGCHSRKALCEGSGGLDLVTQGSLRRLRVTAEALPATKQRVAELAGRFVSAEQWSGCDREPVADSAWLERLTARLDSLPTSVPCVWERVQAYVPTQEVDQQFRRWKDLSKATENPALVRSRQPGGWFSYGWLRSEPSNLLALSKQEALRTMFALDRTARAPLRLPSKEQGAGVELSLTALLPFPEYRLVVSHGEPIPGDGPPLRFRVPKEAWEQLASALQERLGLELP